MSNFVPFTPPNDPIYLTGLLNPRNLCPRYLRNPWLIFLRVLATSWQKNIKKVLKTAALLLKTGSFLLKKCAFLLKNTKKYAFFSYPSCLIVITQPFDPHFQPKIKHLPPKITRVFPHLSVFFIFSIFTAISRQQPKIHSSVGRCSSAQYGLT